MGVVGEGERTVDWHRAPHTGGRWPSGVSGSDRRVTTVVCGRGIHVKSHWVRSRGRRARSAAASYHFLCNVFGQLQTASGMSNTRRGSKANKDRAKPRHLLSTQYKQYRRLIRFSSMSGIQRLRQLSAGRRWLNNAWCSRVAGPRAWQTSRRCLPPLRR